MRIEEMKQLKLEMGLTIKEIAKRSSIPLSTVQKIFSGETPSPRYETMQALEQVFRGSAGIRSLSGGGSAGSYENLSDGLSPQMVAESGAEYGYGTSPRTKKDGEYTISDWESLPDDRRAELIDGVLYDMAPPTYPHQAIAGEIYFKLKEHVKKHHGNCMPFMAPAAVQLDCDDKTMVEPDVFVYCDRDKLHRKWGTGAPDLVIEVLSPSTRRKDMGLKCSKYENAGVREYWIVDPDKRKVIIYLFGEEPDIMISGFDGKVTTHIFEEPCEIDFAEIWEGMAFLLEK